MIVPGSPFRPRNPLILDGRLQYCTRLHLTHHGALHFLPRRLALRIDVTSGGLQALVTFRSSSSDTSTFT